MRGEARRTELAVRQALGAGRGRLVRQLMLESLVLTLRGRRGGPRADLVEPRCPDRVDSRRPAARRVRTCRCDRRAVHRRGCSRDVDPCRRCPGSCGRFAPISCPSSGMAAGDRPARPPGGGAARSSSRRSRSPSRSLPPPAWSRAAFSACSRSTSGSPPTASSSSSSRCRTRSTWIAAGRRSSSTTIVARLEAIPDIAAATPVNVPPVLRQRRVGCPALHGGGAERRARCDEPIAESRVGPSQLFQDPRGADRARARFHRRRSGRGRSTSRSSARTSPTRTWPGEDPIGKRIKMGGPDSRYRWLTIVGVAGSTRYRELTSTARDTLSASARSSS